MNAAPHEAILGGTDKSLAYHHVSRDHGRRQARCRADAECPARAQMIGDPAHDGRADGGAAKRDRQP